MSERDATLSMDLLLQGLSLVGPHVRSPLKWPMVSKLPDMETGVPFVWDTRAPSACSSIVRTLSRVGLPSRSLESLNQPPKGISKQWQLPPLTPPQVKC